MNTLHTIHLDRDALMHSTQPLTQAEAEQLRLDWVTLTTPTTRRALRLAAQRTAQPRGLARLMNDATWKRGALVALGSVAGAVVACAIAAGFVVWASR